MSLSPPVRGPNSQSRGSVASDTSEAKLKLRLLYEQGGQEAAPAKDAVRTTEQSIGLAVKGKPRLLLMGQRR